MKTYLFRNEFWRDIFFHVLEDKNIAFDVRLKSDVRNIATNGRVVFGMVDLNEGKGYDPSTGIFTAPAEGMYVFDWTTLTLPGKYAITSIVVNGKIKSWIIVIMHRIHIKLVAK